MAVRVKETEMVGKREEEGAAVKDTTGEGEVVTHSVPLPVRDAAALLLWVMLALALPLMLPPLLGELRVEAEASGEEEDVKTPEAEPERVKVLLEEAVGRGDWLEDEHCELVAEACPE